MGFSMRSYPYEMTKGLGVHRGLLTPFVFKDQTYLMQRTQPAQTDLAAIHSWPMGMCSQGSPFS